MGSRSSKNYREQEKRYGRRIEGKNIGWCTTFCVKNKECGK